jgi:hypothetical protein
LHFFDLQKLQGLMDRHAQDISNRLPVQGVGQDLVLKAFPAAHFARKLDALKEAEYCRWESLWWNLSGETISPNSLYQDSDSDMLPHI